MNILKYERRPDGIVMADTTEVGQTMLCPHRCGGHFNVVPGSGKRRTFCTRCMAVTCGQPWCDECIPHEAWVESAEGKRNRYSNRIAEILDSKMCCSARVESTSGVDRRLHREIDTAMRLLFALLMTVVALAQDRANNFYVAYKETVLSAAAEVVTVQAPGSGVDRITFADGYAFCTVACSITLERSGTAATSTTLTPLAVSPDTPAPILKAWSASNVGAGTVLAKYDLQANDTLAFDLRGIRFASDSTAKNVTVRTSSITGTVRILIRWTEDKL